MCFIVDNTGILMENAGMLTDIPSDKGLHSYEKITIFSGTARKFYGNVQ